MTPEQAAEILKFVEDCQGWDKNWHIWDEFNVKRPKISEETVRVLRLRAGEER